MTFFQLSQTKVKKLTKALLLAGLIVGGMSIPVPLRFVTRAEATQQWILLGHRSVKDSVDHDTIPVTIAQGGFRRIKFLVRDHAIQINRLFVTYGNGAPDKIEVRQLIPAGGSSRVINLNGGTRVIKKIDFWYETKSLGRQRADVYVYGMR